MINGSGIFLNFQSRMSVASAMLAVAASNTERLERSELIYDSLYATLNQARFP